MKYVEKLINEWQVFVFGTICIDVAEYRKYLAYGFQIKIISNDNNETTVFYA